MSAWEARAREAGVDAAFALFRRMPSANPGDYAQAAFRAVHPIVEEERKAAYDEGLEDGDRETAEEWRQRAEQAEAHADALAKELRTVLEMGVQYADLTDPVDAYRKWKAERP